MASCFVTVCAEKHEFTKRKNLEFAMQLLWQDVLRFVSLFYCSSSSISCGSSSSSSSNSCCSSSGCGNSVCGNCTRSWSSAQALQSRQHPTGGWPLGQLQTSARASPPRQGLLALPRSHQPTWLPRCSCPPPQAPPPKAAVALECGGRSPANQGRLLNYGASLAAEAAACAPAVRRPRPAAPKGHGFLPGHRDLSLHPPILPSSHRMLLMLTNMACGR